MKMEGWHIVESTIELTDSEGRNRKYCWSFVEKTPHNHRE
jgi:hypothetical protein